MFQNIEDKDGEDSTDIEKVNRMEVKIKTAQEFMRMLIAVDPDVNPVFVADPDFESSELNKDKHTLAVIRDIVITMLDDIYDTQVDCAVIDTGVFVFTHDQDAIEDETVKEGLVGVEYIKNNLLDTDVIIEGDDL